MENKTHECNQNKKSTAKYIILSLLSGLLKFAAAALFLITILLAWAGHGLGLLQHLIAAVLYGLAFAIDPSEGSDTKIEPAQGSAPAPSAETQYAPVAICSQPEQERLCCGYCGQPMLIPANRGTIKIICPKCGNSFIFNK